ncbi:MAG: DUF6151 family protein [Burkholderiales bacterium]
MKPGPAAHPITCRCGAFKGEVRRPDHGTRAVCYCRDCQAFARFLGPPPGMMDPLNGTDVVAVRPRFVSFAAGQEHLTCMSLSPKGTLRWYTRCCKTPIGNTPRDMKISHVGLIHTCLEGGAASLDSVFGPVRMRVNAKSAKATAPANSPLEFGWAIARYLASMAWTRVSGQYKVNPFFVAATGQPIVQPHVVSAEERASLRG